MTGPATGQQGDNDSLKDVEQLGLIAALGSLSYVFWIVGGMELVERAAYYGVKAVATLYAKDPVSKGGLGIKLSEFGTILSSWALVQSLVPVFSGGLSDRFGYKETIFASTVVKIIGYLIMAFFPSYWGFFAGAVVLASGTAIFKPGIQGTLVKATNRQNSSMAWGVFYQTVNIGGFLAPLIAGFMRKLEWQYVFFACAAIISLNFIFLLLYKEPGKEERLKHLQDVKEGKAEQKSLVTESIAELQKPHVALYLLIFSGFWFMFNALFDVLPAHIDDWVDTRGIVSTLFGTDGTDSEIVKFFIVMNKEGTEILPEGLLNINSMLIMFTCFFFAWVSGLMRATTSMMIGTLLASAAMFASGFSTLGWISVGAILLFSVGEMLSSPKFSEYIGNFAPSDKKGMYLGFSQIPLAIGWTLEGKIAPAMYEKFASKDQFSRDLLIERNLTFTDAQKETFAKQILEAKEALSGDELKALSDGEASKRLLELVDGATLSERWFIDNFPQGNAFPNLIEITGEDKWALTAQMYETHDVWMVWLVMGVVGILTSGAIMWYGGWVLKRTRAT